MIDSNVLHGFLDKLAKDAMEQIEKEGKLSQQNALPFLIKDQYQKINHIESDFVTKSDLAHTNDKINEVDKNLSDKIDDLRSDIFREIAQREKVTRIYFGILTTLIVLSLSKAYI